MGLLRKKKLLRKASSGNGPVNEVLSQFGVVAPLTGSRSEGDASDMMNASEESSNDALICSNMPYVRFNYMDYASKKEKVVIFVDFPGGSGDYKWEFNDAGDSITLLVDWSKSLYDVTQLFKADLRKNEITMDHPKLHAMQSELLKQGISSKQIPKFSIQIPLGKKVHKDDDTWDVTLMKHDGNKILTIEFSGFQEEVLKKVKAGTFQ